MSNKELTNTLADQIKLDEDGEPTVKYYIQSYEINKEYDYNMALEYEYTFDDLEVFKNEKELIEDFEKHYIDDNDRYYELVKYIEDGFENYEILAVANYDRQVEFREKRDKEDNWEEFFENNPDCVH